MSEVVVLHGIGQQVKGGHVLHAELFAALRDGVVAAGADIAAGQVEFAFYGRVFRPRGEVLGAQEFFDADDVADGFEEELLRARWERAAAVDDRVVPPDAEVLSRSPRWAQRALFALSNSRYFAAAGDSLLVGDLKQVRGYLTDDRVRREVQDAVAGAVAADTRVVVGHSLGSVVAYEALCAHPEWPVRALVTLGSPLGLRLVFDRLRPPRGAWPGPVTAWTNLADSGDVVAVVEDLRPLFGPGVRQVRVHNGSSAHDLRPYLTERLTGAAIAAGMRG